MATGRTKKPLVPNTVVNDFAYFGSSVSDSRLELLNSYTDILVLNLIDEFILFDMMEGRTILSDENTILLFMFYIEYILLDIVPYYIDHEELTCSADSFAAYNFIDYGEKDQYEGIAGEFITYNAGTLYKIGESLKTLLTNHGLKETDVMPCRWNTVASVAPISERALHAIELAVVLRRNDAR